MYITFLEKIGMFRFGMVMGHMYCFRKTIYFSSCYIKEKWTSGALWLIGRDLDQYFI